MPACRKLFWCRNELNKFGAVRFYIFIGMIENISVTIRPDKQLPFSEEELLSICGLFGIHPEPNTEDKIIVEINPYVDCVRININSEAVSNLQVVIYPTNKYLENQFIRAKKVGGGIGSRWVKAQSAAAGSHDFKRMIAEAYRADDRSGDWTGYVVWAKYGYVMQVSSQTDFERFLIKHNRKEVTLYELISNEGGLKLWQDEGFSWDAEFDLAPDSESNRILTAYFARKTGT